MGMNDLGRYALTAGAILTVSCATGKAAKAGTHFGYSDLGSISLSRDYVRPTGGIAGRYYMFKIGKDSLMVPMAYDPRSLPTPDNLDREIEPTLFVSRGLDSLSEPQDGAALSSVRDAMLSSDITKRYMEANGLRAEDATLDFDGIEIPFNTDPGSRTFELELMEMAHEAARRLVLHRNNDEYLHGDPVEAFGLVGGIDYDPVCHQAKTTVATVNWPEKK